MEKDWQLFYDFLLCIILFIREAGLCYLVKFITKSVSEERGFLNLPKKLFSNSASNIKQITAN